MSEEGAKAMAERGEATRGSWAGRWLGPVGLVAGLVAATSTAIVGAISFTAWDPAEWFRIAAFWLMVLGTVTSVPVSLVAVFGPRRAMGIAGLVLGSLSVAAIAVMFSAAE